VSLTKKPLYGAFFLFFMRGGWYKKSFTSTVEADYSTTISIPHIGLDSDGAHSVNEKFGIDNFINGIKTCVHLLTNI